MTNSLGSALAGRAQKIVEQHLKEIRKNMMRQIEEQDVKGVSCSERNHSIIITGKKISSRFYGSLNEAPDSDLKGLVDDLSGR